MQVGLRAISELSGGGELTERGREGALGSDSQEAGPARNPSGDGQRPQQARDSSGPMKCKKAQELHGLATKPAADLNRPTKKTVWFCLFLDYYFMYSGCCVALPVILFTALAVWFRVYLGYSACCVVLPL